MPHFSQKSKDNLESCDSRLQYLFNQVVRHFDCTILIGHRTEEDQEKAFNDGKSKLHYPDSKHNRVPSYAVDVAPYPVDWDDRRRFDHFAGFVKGIASQVGLNIRWGGDWSGDFNLNDQTFDDLVHFEIINN